MLDGWWEKKGEKKLKKKLGSIPNTSRTRLTRHQANIIAWTKLAQSEKDAVNDDEASHVFGLVEPGIASGHDESNDALQHNANRKRLLGPHGRQIGHKRTSQAAGHVEEVDENVPGQTLPQRRRLAQQVGQDGSGVDAKGVGAKVVDEPYDAHDPESKPVKLDNQQPRGLRFGKRFALEGFGLLQLETQVQERQGRDDADAEADAPGGAEVLLACCEHDDGGDDCADEEGEVDLHVGEEDEPFVARAFAELARRFGTAYATGWVFAADAFFLAG